MGSGLSLFAQTPEAPLPDPSGMDKVRFISLSIPPPSQNPPETALRIWLTSLHHVDPPYTAGPSASFDLFEGLYVWAGPPGDYLESQESGIVFQASITQCAPHYRDWSTIDLLHVTGSHIIPSSTYDVEQVAISCQGQEDKCTDISSPLQIRTNRWADVEVPFGTASITGQPNLADVSALTNKFRDSPGALIKPRALIAWSGNTVGEMTPSHLSVDFGFTNIAWAVDAFRGRPYFGRMGRCLDPIRNCAADPSIICSSDADCAGLWPLAGCFTTFTCNTHAGCGPAGTCIFYCPDID